MRILKHTVNEVQCQVVTKNNLLSQTIENPEHRKSKHAMADVVLLVKLWNEVAGLDDRSGN